MMEVEKVRPVDVTWSVMSLSVLNEGATCPTTTGRCWTAAWGPVRVVIAAREKLGDEIVKPLYDALGTRIHLQKSATSRHRRALEEVGLPAELADAATPTSTTALRASHQRAIDLVGDEVGTPVVAVNEEAFFGPVVSPAPKGEAAGRPGRCASWRAPPVSTS